jgi:hypothetical protein
MRLLHGVLDRRHPPQGDILMKVKGKKVEGRNIEVVVIPRPEDDIVFFCEAIPDYEEFNELCPAPTPPEKLYPGGVRKPDTESPEFKEKMEEWATLRTHWTVLKSLENCPDIEWETIDMEKPSTWTLYEKELKEAGFTEIENYRILQGVMRANSLDDEMLNEAKKSFLQGQSLKNAK